VLTDEGNTYATLGSPEFQLILAIPPEGISRDELQVAFFILLLLSNLFRLIVCVRYQCC